MILATFAFCREEFWVAESVLVIYASASGVYLLVDIFCVVHCQARDNAAALQSAVIVDCTCNYATCLSPTFVCGRPSFVSEL